MRRLVIIGASGHGKVVADIAKRNGYTDIAFLDDNEKVTERGGYPVVGKTSDTDRFTNVDFVIAIGNVNIREKIQNRIGKVTTLIHPEAVIAENVTIGRGTVVMAGAVINPGTVIGNGCIINTCSSVDHDCIIADFVHVSVGTHIAGTVEVKDRTWIGAGVIISNNVNICSDCMIGAGAIVIRDITEPGTYIGVLARRIKTMQKTVKIDSGGYHPAKKIEYAALRTYAA